MPPQLIDDFAPQWQFREIHRIGVLAPPEVALRAIREVTAREIRLFRLLTWVRRLGIPGRESILHPPPDQPIIDVALRTGFLLLASSPPDPLSASRRGGTFGEIVLGSTVVMPHGAAPPTNPGRISCVALTRLGQSGHEFPRRSHARAVRRQHRDAGLDERSAHAAQLRALLVDDSIGQRLDPQDVAAGDQAKS